jgi:O-antigen ligase
VATLSIVVVSAVSIFTLLNRNSGFLPEGRPRILTKVFLGALNRPILGWGWANVDYAFKKVPYPIYFQNDIYLDKAHSHLLEIFTTTGFIGLAIYLTIICYLLKIIWRKIKYYAVMKDQESIYWQQTLFLVLLLFLFHSQTNVISIAEEIYFWLVAGIVTSYS